MKNLLPNLVNRTLYLGSKSPRRKELLEKLEIQFKLLSIEVDESFDSNLKAYEVAEFLAKEKSGEGLKRIRESDLLITADTLVTIDEKILNKPQTFEEANDMLWTLSGKTHEVITGVSVADQAKSITFHSTTLVTFARLEQKEIDFYLNRFLPYDKAGSYGIQEWLGMACIDKIQGSFYNVMGLPVNELYRVLKLF